MRMVQGVLFIRKNSAYPYVKRNLFSGSLASKRRSGAGESCVNSISLLFYMYEKLQKLFNHHEKVTGFDALACFHMDF